MVAVEQGVTEDTQPFSREALQQRLPKLSVYPELIPFVAHSPWLIDHLARLGTHNTMKSAHSWRMGAATLQIGTQMHLDSPLMAPFVEAALGHDYGFVEIPNTITDKPETLTEGEELQIKSHPQVAIAALSPHSKVVVGLIETVHQFQRNMYPEVCTTDFYYSTQNYEDGLPYLYEKDIPRILSALDKYDAFRDPERQYRIPLSREEACQAILSLRDPEGKLIYEGFTDTMKMIADAWEAVRLEELANQETPVGL